MSQLLINKYLNELAKLRRVSGTNRESVVREAFKDLLKDWAKQHDLTFIPEYEVESKTKERRYVDGALLHTLRIPFGYWEAKDEKDNLDEEIDVKFRRGYPKTNIIFEDSREAVLIQHGSEVMRCTVEDVAELEKLLKLFFGYERPEIEAFRKAVEQFKIDLPAVLEALRGMIEKAERANAKFRKAASEFLAHAQEAINPSLTDADVREMLIQHVLTGEVFAAVFPGTSFHEDNNIARELHKLEDTFFTGNTKHQTLKGLAPYYAAIGKAARDIGTHHEKQTFLKAIYENFYKVYNPKAADRLGVVYTPNEIVRFMIESADWLCEQHFGKSLIDKDVDILDPAVGTGTFICELIEHFRGQPKKLAQKYRHELHANEVAILPYYVANLNIEATHAAVTGDYEEFPGLCFVDTLDNTYALRKHAGHMDDLFGSVTDDNVKRIRQQNSKRISVIIGNPPYNANQLNENENNKNREYPEIDKRIKDTYIAESTAQKTKLYDMYARFFRWASDRLDENGVLALITNRSFIDSRTFDGFRKTIAKEFSNVYVVDLGGDWKQGESPEAGGGNVFGIGTGVAISFLVRKNGANKRGQQARIRYIPSGRFARTGPEKLAWLASSHLQALLFEEVQPDVRGNWLNLTANDFAQLIPVASREAKLASREAQERAIFKLHSLGVATNRDDWVYDNSRENLERKIRYFIQAYESERARWHKSARDKPIRDFVIRDIKWTSELEALLAKNFELRFAQERIRVGNYRPFVRTYIYYDRFITHRLYQQDSIFPVRRNWENCVIAYTQAGSQKPFCVGISNGLMDLHFVGAAAGTECLPLYRIDKEGDLTDNITDWSLEQFKKHYQPSRGKKDRPITKEAIFHYVYGVLHDPVYREKYALNLKREFPRIPFYADFWQWADWGKTLMDCHIGYESVKPFPLKRTDMPDEKARKANMPPRAALKADKDAGVIRLDSETTLSGVPAEAWTYVLGNRSALEWVLDQYKEKTPKDPTIREKFNTYRFADYKEKVIDLLIRVTTVSVETMKIVDAMKAARR